MLVKWNYSKVMSIYRNLLTEHKMLTAAVAATMTVLDSLKCMLRSCFPFCFFKCLLLIILLWADECQASDVLNLCVWEIALQCLLSKFLWVVEISPGFFYLFSSFHFKNGSRAWCMPDKCADPELHVCLPTTHTPPFLNRLGKLP